MAYVLITHDVEDYDAWKVIFDIAAPIRKEAGEISYQVLRYEQDPKKLFTFQSGRPYPMQNHSLSLLK